MHFYTILLLFLILKTLHYILILESLIKFGSFSSYKFLLRKFINNTSNNTKHLKNIPSISTELRNQAKS
jgi:hypothetical protein